MDENNHTFAVCAYGESPYLEECIQSLLAQTVSTGIVVATSTSNEHIATLAAKYDLPLYVRDGQSGIAADWNYAIEAANTPFVTVAHQDDIYSETYAEEMLDAVAMHPDLLVFFTNYGELRNGKVVDDNKLLTIKRRMLAPLENGKHASSIFVRRRILSLGSAICCPSVTINTAATGTPVFREGLKSNLDWEAWERLSKLSGVFYYDSKILMHHRIHEQSETTHLIEGNIRGGEDLVMFKKFWPSPIAKAINVVYSSSEKSNE